MIKWGHELQVIDTPWGRMTRNLAPLVDAYQAERERRRREFGEVVRAGEPVRCGACGEEIAEGESLVHFPHQGRIACAVCAGLQETAQ
jgi:hypothetical protein